MFQAKVAIVVLALLPVLSLASEEVTDPKTLCTNCTICQYPNCNVPPASASPPPPPPPPHVKCPPGGYAPPMVGQYPPPYGYPYPPNGYPYAPPTTPFDTFNNSFVPSPSPPLWLLWVLLLLCSFIVMF